MAVSFSTKIAAVRDTTARTDERTDARADYRNAPVPIEAGMRGFQVGRHDGRRACLVWSENAM